MSYYIGVDSGGTSTSFVLFNEDGEIKEQVTKPTMHVLQTTSQETINIIQSGLSELTASHQGVIDLVSFGIAGYGNDPHLRYEIEARVKRGSSKYPYYIYSDAKIALSAAHLNQDGMIVIAGTGSMGLAKIGNHYVRVGGWGYHLGDEGSGYWIGKELLNAYTKEVDGRYKSSRLIEEVMLHFELMDPYALIQTIAKSKNQRNTIANLAPLVFKLAEQNIPSACNILVEAGIALAQLPNTLISHYKSKTVYLALVGGLWQSNSILYDTFHQALHPSIVIRPTQSPLEWGAILLAKEEQDERLFENSPGI